MRPDKIKFPNTAQANKRRKRKQSRKRNFYFRQINGRFFLSARIEKIFPANGKMREACRAARNLLAEVFRRPGKIWQTRVRFEFRKPNNFDYGLQIADCGIVFHCLNSLFTFYFYLLLPLLAALRETLKFSFSRIAKSCKARRKISRSRIVMTAVWSAVSSA